MAFLTKQRILGFKAESVAYTGETLAATDYDVAAYNINYGTEIEQYDRPVSAGNFARFTSVPGKQMGTVSFSVDVAKTANEDIGTAPTWGKVLECAGFEEFKDASAGVLYRTNSDQLNTATIEIADTEEGSGAGQRVVKFTGCQGSVKFVVDQVGNPIRMDFEFKGAIDGVSDRATAFAATNIEVTTPDSVLSATVTAGGFSGIDCNSIEVDMGIDVQMEIDPSASSGYAGSHIVGRAVQVTIDPYMTDYATRDWFAQNMTPNGNVNPFVLSTENFTLYLPELQVVNSLQQGDRNGLVTESVTFRSVRAPDDDDFYIMQGAYSFS